MACLRSHLEVLKIARDKGLKNVLILEDDVYFADGFKEKLDKVMQDLPDNWDALHLGGTDHPTRRAKFFTMHLNKCDYTTGAFGIVINETIFDFLIEKISEEKKQVDIYYAELQNKLNWFRTKENLVKHRNGWSTIKEKEVEYKNLQ